MQTSKKLTLIAMIGVVWLIGGCSQIGQRFEYESGTRIDHDLYLSITAEGMSKQSILSLTGQPQKRKVYKGREIWLFEYKKSSTVPMIPQPIIYEQIVLEFDKKGTLSKHRRRAHERKSL
jgi:outer membrane protein assembly factor BamE (lipoprotein component of BamABCDE complex)